MPRVGILGSTRNETNVDLVDRWHDLGLDTLVVSPREALTRLDRNDVVGYDVRILVAGGTVVGAEERVAAPWEWRTNISLGGSHRAMAPSPSAAALAVAAVAALGGDFFGVDLMPVRSGYAVLAVNGAADFDANYSLWNGDVFAEAAGALGLRSEPVADPDEAVAVAMQPPTCG